MNIDMSQLAPYFWILVAILAIIVVFVVIRFFWHHVLKYLCKAAWPSWGSLSCWRCYTISSNCSEDSRYVCNRQKTSRRYFQDYLIFHLKLRDDASGCYDA